MTGAQATAEKLAEVGSQHLRTYSLDIRLLHAGFVDWEPQPGLKIYECHSGAFSVQVRHDANRGAVTAWLAFRGEEIMKYRPWSVPLAGEREVIAEVLAFLRIVGTPALNPGD